MRNYSTLLLATFGILGGLALQGCSYHARGPEDYRSDTRRAIESSREEIRTCYDEVLKKKRKAAGTVVVSFKVEKKTGQFKDVQVDESATTAPEPIVECVMNILSNLILDPPDARDGIAESFTLEFTPPKT